MEYLYRRYRDAFILCALILVGVIAFSWPAISVQHSPVVFSRTEIVISAPKRVAVVTAESETAQPLPPQTEIRMIADMRPASSFENPSLFLTRPLQQNHAYLIPLPNRPLNLIRRSNVLTPIDVVVIDKQGTVQQIFPKLIMNDLQLPITLPSNSGAVLYLAGGNAEMLNLLPRYQVKHALFEPPPIILR